MSAHSNTVPITDRRIRERLGQAICLTGIARSGTTLMGSLLHSMRNVEYSFEPPTLVMLFLLLEHMPAEAWKLIYETYLFDELMVNGLGGRFMNLNPHDDSSILRSKPLSEIAGRMEKTSLYGELFDEGLRRTIAYKIPDLMPRIPLLRQLYPETRCVVMLRHPDPVALSTGRKAWYLPPKLTYRDSGILREFAGELVPAWIPEQDAAEWVGISEFDRCYRFYSAMYGPLLAQKDILVVQYESLVERPAEVVGAVAERLGLEFGAKTPELLAQVRERQPRDVVPEGVTPACRQKALEIHRECVRLAI